jgi:hypothetical protein
MHIQLLRTITGILLSLTIVVAADEVGAQQVDLPPVYLSHHHLAVIYRDGMSSAQADSFGRAHGLLPYRPSEGEYIPSPLNMRVYTLDRSVLPGHITVQDVAHRLRMRWPHIVYMSEPLDHEFSVPSPSELMVRYDENTAWSKIQPMLEQAGLNIERRGQGFALCRVNRSVVGLMTNAATIADRLSAEHGDVVKYAEPNTYWYANSLTNETASAPTTDAPLRILPNPFNPNTAIHYDMMATGDVSLVVYNTLGQRVRTLVHGDQLSGVHRVTWNGLDDVGQRVASGVYMIRLSTEHQSAVSRVTISY